MRRKPSVAPSAGVGFTAEMWPLAKVKPYEKNPRKNEGAIDAVAKSIQEFGFRVPIGVDGDGVVIAGHTRLKAAEKLGLEKVPVHVARELSPDKVRALRIADNKLHELSSWDMELLPIELGDLQSADFDLSLLGFSEEDLSALMAPAGNDGSPIPTMFPARTTPRRPCPATSGCSATTG